MAAGDVLLDSDGNVSLQSAGEETLSDGSGDDCCCDTGTDCIYCNNPLPTDYDLTMSGVTPCPFTTIGPTSMRATNQPVPAACTYAWDNTDPSSLNNAADAGIFDDGAGGSEFSVKVTPYQVVGGSVVFSSSRSGASYGPDCTQTIVLNNGFITSTTSDPGYTPTCNTGDKAGYGGTVTAVAVLPP